MKPKKLMREYPIPGCIAAAVSVVVLMWAVGMIRKILPERIVWDYARQLVNILWPYALTVLLGCGWCYRRGSFKKTLLAGSFALVLFSATFLIRASEAILNDATVWKPAAGIILGIINILGIGFREETIFRGVIANNLGIAYGRDTRGVWKAVIISGLIFGLVHLTNIFSGVNPIRVLIQIASACALGMYFTAVYFRGGSLWPLVLIHCLTDAGGLFRSAFTMAETTVETVNNLRLTGLIMVPIYIGITVFLLRMQKMDEVLDNLNRSAECDR